jgi:hypothetical protein
MTTQETESKWPEVFGAVVIVLIVLALVITGLDQWHWFKDDAAAGWAQAIMASIATASGAYGLWWQAKQLKDSEERRLVTEDVRRLQIVMAALFDMQMRLQAKIYLELGIHQAEWSAVDQATNLLESINLLEIPDWKLTFAIRQAVDRYRAFRVLVPFPDAPKLPPKKWHIDAQTMLDDTVSHFDRARQCAMTAIQDRGGKIPRIQAAVGSTVFSSDDK